MPRRTVVVFWAAVAAGGSLLGAAVASAQRVLRDGSAADTIVLTLSAFGFVMAMLVAGRIVTVLARLQRRASRS